MNTPTSTTAPTVLTAPTAPTALTAPCIAELNKISLSAAWLTHLAAGLDRATPALCASGADLLATLNLAVIAVRSEGMPMNTGLGCALKFVPQACLPADHAYETYIARTGNVPTRLNLHDFFNACVWLTFPRTKAMLNARQYQQIQQHGIHNKRGMARDALTLFDENAAILVTSDPQIASALRHFDWQNALVTVRNLWDDPFNPQPEARAAVYLLGHALLEKLTAPRKNICAHTWVVVVEAAWFLQNLPARLADLDARLSAQLQEHQFHTHDFCPLPVLGVPHFWPENCHATFYQDTDVFRAGRLRKDFPKS